MIVSNDTIKDIVFKLKKRPNFSGRLQLQNYKELKNINLSLEIMDNSNFGMMFFLCIKIVIVVLAVF